MIGERAERATAVSLDAFHAVWPRFLPLDELRALLGPEADGLLRDALGRQVAAPLWSLVDRGGKRWRTVIGRLAYLVCGGREPAPEAVFEVAELLHNASLVVDDIEDGATERRGGPPAHLTYGVPVALNAANAAYFRAFAVLRGELPDAQRLRALDMLSEELFAAHLGQALDLTLGAYSTSATPPGTAHYAAVARAKTGALVRIAARLGAIAAGADGRLEQALAGWASEVGVAYQIRDDVEDLAAGSTDLARGRLTYPVLALLESDGGAAADEVARVLEAGTSGAHGARLVALLESSGAVARSRVAAREAALRAATALAALPPSPHRDALAALTRQLAGAPEGEP
jgi:geranylgeranyl diphosphate synthase type I